MQNTNQGHFWTYPTTKGYHGPRSIVFARFPSTAATIPQIDIAIYPPIRKAAREELRRAQSQTSSWQRDNLQHQPVLKCNNCHHVGHTLGDCRGPTDVNGLIYGCFQCENKTHITEECPLRSSDVFGSLLYHLVIRRVNFPPGYCTFPVEEIPGYKDVWMRPWTSGFALVNAGESNSSIYQDWPYFEEAKEAVFNCTFRDPAYDLPNSYVRPYMAGAQSFFQFLDGQFAKPFDAVTPELLLAWKSSEAPPSPVGPRIGWSAWGSGEDDGLTEFDRFYARIRMDSPSWTYEAMLDWDLWKTDDPIAYATGFSAVFPHPEFNKHYEGDARNRPHAPTPNTGLSSPQTSRSRVRSESHIRDRSETSSGFINFGGIVYKSVPAARAAIIRTQLKTPPMRVIDSDEGCPDEHPQISQEKEAAPDGMDENKEEDSLAALLETIREWNSRH